MPRDAIERWIRALTPYHFFLCKDCERRGLHWGVVATLPADIPSSLVGRPLEKRDHVARTRLVFRLLASIALAVVLGTASGLLLHSCQARHELQAAERTR